MSGKWRFGFDIVRGRWKVKWGQRGGRPHLLRPVDGARWQGVPGFDRRTVKAALFRLFPFSPPFFVFAPVQVLRDQSRPFCFRFDGPSSRCRNSDVVFLVCRPAQLSNKRRRQPQLSVLQCAYTSAQEARQGLAPFMQKRSGEY